MRMFKKLPVYGFAVCFLALTVPTACQPLSNTVATDSAVSGAAVTGIVFASRARDGRLLPPDAPVSVEILDETNQVVKSVRTDDAGQFFIDDIGVSAQNVDKGQAFSVRIQAANFTQNVRLFPGRVLNVSSVKVAGTDTQKQEVRTVNGILLGPDQQPLSGATIRDKDFSFRSTQTNSEGEFSLEVVSTEIEVLISESSAPFPINVSEFDSSPIAVIDTNNVRRVSGTIQDSTNANVFLRGVKVKVGGTSISTTTGADGRFSLNGAPVGPFSLELSGLSGYLDTSVQIPPATFSEGGQNPLPVEELLVMRPVGTIQVNFSVEDAPGFAVVPEDPARFGLPTGSSLGCIVEYNCRQFDLNGDGSFESIYHNSFGVRNALQAVVSVQGTDISEDIPYPPAEELDLKGTDAAGEVKIFPAAVVAPNQVVSVLLPDVPGGRQNITISMTGMQTQKSVSVYVPPKDTISTELITLYRVQPLSGVGDVQGFIRGVSPEDIPDIKINFVDLKETITYEADVHSNPVVLRQIQTALRETSAASMKSDGSYYLKNVPTGSRIMLVAGTTDATGQEDCYIPNSSVLLNVQPGILNYAPDLSLTKRPAGECGNIAE